MHTKHTLIAALAAFACSAALAQAPANTNTRPPAEVNPAASGGAAAANAQNKADTRAATTSGTPQSPTAGHGGKVAPVAEIDPTKSGGKAAAKADARSHAKVMDTNADGMVSRQEWDTYHASAWTAMKPGNLGVSTADIDKANRTHMLN